MATVDEDLKAYLTADSATARQVGTRIYENHVPQTPQGQFNSAVPFLYFVRTGEETFDALDDAQGVAPNIVRFAVECIGRNVKESIAIAALVKARCHKAVKATMGSRTATLFCEDQSEDYVARSGAGDNGFHVSALQVEVFV